ncbi:hypothetical protein HYC85_019440 [Camellia sinensis]|uniref:Pentacotripeptide-repeat region of PRORP domain-containing protein n=1 Tax=Camellia sinensis TaxID=4442 RepID=A0A7J7GQV3_CAMSI|nr:hypothetical protein HYC85_019440 [Camellia sinensis]
MLSEACELFLQMEEKGCSPDSISFNIIIQGFLRENEIDKAMQLFGEMRNRNFLPNEMVSEMLLHLVLVDEQHCATVERLPNVLQKDLFHSTGFQGYEPQLAAVATGSHIDAIPYSGKYDGVVDYLAKPLTSLASLWAGLITFRSTLDTAKN